ncbi:rRNA maturation RNase YbeY [Psychrobacter sp. FDAARGOS_221]|uniref:rRNA maturation RNase YbeY n=1 Tax=Psychrobacter sp. FDAARGOS_221 TaxID=1975705 RepID=UPI000BB5586E|nr:rRNA maturation RNase YbeY [Psychrobacter sp. FDAARGOS_221]PNK61201.1 rRNA maturation RNase YbeY [Psychrobacter sp. FDAARGOS_221]
MSNSLLPTIDISASDAITDSTLDQYYSLEHIQQVLTTTLDYMSSQPVDFPYFEELAKDEWSQKPKELSVYLTDSTEGRALNLEARDKDYATNILSYSSDLPAFILTEMPSIPLGELIICHEVVEQQAAEQNKPIAEHATHLLVHGILHLLGFDHELGQAEQDEMEGFEIAILEKLGIGNPYIAR